MLLVIDIGNTNITLGVYDNDTLIKTFRLSSDIHTTSKEYEKIFKNSLSNLPIANCVIGSVVNKLDIKIKKVIDKILKINSIIVDANSNIGMKILTPQPELVGIDRIANIAGARKYTNPMIIVDIGTATTFDITDKDGNFYGGIIIPGINIQLKSLHDYTSKLPLIKPKKISKVIAHNTEDCILSGVIKGHACAIEGLISECEQELGKKVTIVATGGLCPLIAEHMKRKFDYIEPNLTLNGLKELYKLNLTQCILS